MCTVHCRVIRLRRLRVKMWSGPWDHVSQQHLAVPVMTMMMTSWRDFLNDRHAWHRSVLAADLSTVVS